LTAYVRTKHNLEGLICGHFVDTNVLNCCSDLDNSFIFYKERTMLDPLTTYEIERLRQRERLDEAKIRRKPEKIQTKRTGTLGRLTPQVGKVLTVLGLSLKA
jgi:hypothetical protein